MDAAALRRRLQARRLRKRRQLLSPLLHPSDLRYRYDLLSITRQVQRLITEELSAWASTRVDSHTDAKRESLAALFARLRIKAEELVRALAPTTSRKMVRQVAEANRIAMNAQMKRVIKIDPFVNNAGLERVMRERVATNVELIKSIPEQLLDQVERIVVPNVEAGVRVEELKTQIQKRFEVSASRAKLIARDQVGKWNGQLVKERQQALGIGSYTWSTSKDERVRVDHAALEGKVFSYDNPPIIDVRTGRRGNPGEDYQCRCSAIPRVSDVLDALGIPDVDDDATF